MFKSILNPAKPLLSNEVLSVAIEKCFEEIQSKIVLIDRLDLARECMSAIPDKDVTQEVVTLFATSLIDIDKQFIPEISNNSLESSLASSGKEAKAFALESADGILGRIWKFIINLIAKITDLISNLYDRIVGNNKKQEVEEKVIAAKVKAATAVAAKEEIHDAVIKIKTSYACFVIGGRFTTQTIDKVLNDLYEITKKAKAEGAFIKGGIKSNLEALRQNTQKLNEVLKPGWSMDLTPRSDYPGYSKIEYEPSGNVFFKKTLELDAIPDEADVIRSVDDLVLKKKDFMMMEDISTMGARDNLVMLSANMRHIAGDLKSQAQGIHTQELKRIDETRAFREQAVIEQRVNEFKNSLLIIPAFMSAVVTIQRYVNATTEATKQLREEFVYSIKPKVASEE